MTEPFVLNIYSYINENRDWKRSYVAFSSEEDDSLAKSFRRDSSLKSVRSYKVEDASKKLPILRAVMSHRGNEEDLKSKIESILEN
jgi:hypothetical protein